MALKYRIKKEAFEKLSDEMKAEYKEKDGEYVLDVDGIDNAEELKNALENERKAGREKGAKAAKLQEQIEEMEREQRRKNGNIEEIEADYRRQIEELKAAQNTELEGYRSRIERGLIDQHVNSISNEITTAPKLLAPHIRDRLSVDWESGEPKLIIKDQHGKASGMKPEELQKEFQQNPDYKSVIIASKGSGGGGAPNEPNGGGAPYEVPKGESGKKKSLHEMSGEELAAYTKANYSEVEQG